MKHEGSPWGDLSPHQQDTLRAFEDLLRAVAIPRGMVASSDTERLRQRHVVDSLRALPWIPSETAHACDLGSGAGLPGIPIAVAEPTLEVTLSETRLPRVAFLELAIERLALTNVVVRSGPAQELPEDRFDACFARGFADASSTWDIAERVLRPGGRLLYWAGRSFRGGDAPSGVRRQVVTSPLESSGPIVIMTRQ